MASRIELQKLLEDVLGSRQVYFQPPETVKMSYPAIVYSLNDIDNRFADDDVYRQNRSYQITVIDRNPDSEVRDRISLLPKSRFNRYFASDNLNHYVFIMYF